MRRLYCVFCLVCAIFATAAAPQISQATDGFPELPGNPPVDCVPGFSALGGDSPLDGEEDVKKFRSCLGKLTEHFAEFVRREQRDPIMTPECKKLDETIKQGTDQDKADRVRSGSSRCALELLDLFSLKLVSDLKHVNQLRECGEIGFTVRQDPELLQEDGSDKEKYEMCKDFVVGDIYRTSSVDFHNVLARRNECFAIFEEMQTTFVKDATKFTKEKKQTFDGCWIDYHIAPDDDDATLARLEQLRSAAQLALSNLHTFIKNERINREAKEITKAFSASNKSVTDEIAKLREEIQRPKKPAVQAPKLQIKSAVYGDIANYENSNLPMSKREMLVCNYTRALQHLCDAGRLDDKDAEDKKIKKMVTGSFCVHDRIPTVNANKICGFDPAPSRDKHLKIVWSCSDEERSKGDYRTYQYPDGSDVYLICGKPREEFEKGANANATRKQSSWSN